MGFKRGRSTHDGTPVPDRWAYAHPNTMAIEQMEECVRLGMQLLTGEGIDFTFSS